MSFAKSVKDATLGLKGMALRSVKATIRNTCQRIINDTPVDSGRLKNNWYASNRNPPKRTTMAQDKSGQRSKVRVEEALARLKVGQNFYFVNNLPYARTVEYGLYPNPPKNPTGKTVNGFSKQAPQGMLRTNVRKTMTGLARRKGS